MLCVAAPGGHAWHVSRAGGLHSPVGHLPAGRWVRSSPAEHLLLGRWRGSIGGQREARSSSVCVYGGVFCKSLAALSVFLSLGPSP